LGFNLASRGLFFHSHFHCELAGSDIAQRRVRSVPVVILPPCPAGGDCFRCDWQGG